MIRTCGILVLATLGSAPAVAQSNTWLVLSPTPNALWEPGSFTDCTRKASLANPPGRTYSGTVFGDGQIYYWGGGHQSYPGNDMVVYDIATNQWIPDAQQPQCLHPACKISGGTTDGSLDTYDNYPSMTPGTNLPWNINALVGSCVIGSGTGGSKPIFRCAGGSRNGLACAVDADCSAGSVWFPGTTGTGTCSVGIPVVGQTCPTCRPLVEHMYQRAAYNTVRHKELLVTFNGTWEYDVATRAFTWLCPPPPESADQSDRMVVWDPPRARMLYFQLGGAASGVYAFNYTTNTWTLWDQPPTTQWAEVFGSWNEQVNKFVIWFGKGVGWYTYEPGAKVWTSISAGTPADVNTPECSTTSGIYPCWTTATAYDGTIGRTIVLTQDPGAVLAVWTYDAVNNAWQKLITTGATAAGANAGYPNTLHYDPGTGSLFLVEMSGFWSAGPGGTVRVKKVALSLGGTPLPTNTPINTGTITATPTQTRTPTPGGGTSTPTPVCAGTVRLVGPGRTYAKVSQAAAAAQTNDCIYIDAGTYTNDFALARWLSGVSNLTIRGVGGMAKMTITNGDVSTGMASDGSKGIWVINSPNTTVENIEFSCATSRANNINCSGVLVGDGNDAGIRLQAAGLTVRNCIFHDNDDGILGGPNISGISGTVLIENTEFFRNGLGDGQTHNLYLNGHNDTLIFRYNYSHGGIVGMNLKSRAVNNFITYNRFMDEGFGNETMPGAPGGYCTDPGTCAASVQVQFPCGGIDYVIGNVVQKGLYADASELIKFGAEEQQKCTGNNANCASDADCVGQGTCASINCTMPQRAQELYVVNNTFVSAYPSTARFIRGYGLCAGGSNMGQNCETDAACPNSTCTGTNGTAALVWSKNNIFIGSGTTLSWPNSGTQVTSNNVTTNPQLLSQSTYDYHLTAGSTAVINQGIDPGINGHGFNLFPTQHYVYDRGFTARPTDATLDVGAFEYVAGATPFPTPTSTPTYTFTPRPVSTATPASPVYCPAGQREAVYAIAVSGDDGIVQRSGANYTALGSPVQSTADYVNYWNYTTRKNQGTAPFLTRLALWRWNTGALPDGSSWPIGTQIAGAFIRPYWTGPGSGSRPLIWEWHNWSTLSDADFTNTSALASDPTFAATSTMPGAIGRQTIPLTNAAANVTLTSYTGLRLTVDDGTAPAPNEVNEVALRPRDFLTSAGDQSTQLVICYLLGPTPTPQPPSAPQLL